MARLDSRPGTYALLLRADAPGTIQVGRLGKMDIRPGFYVYSGSALGPGGLRARVSRHERIEKPCRWHIDYLRAVTDVQEVWFTCDERRRECQWADVLGDLPHSLAPLCGFGASDCSCRTHLHFFVAQPSVSVFRRRLRQVAPDQGPVKYRQFD